MSEFIWRNHLKALQGDTFAWNKTLKRFAFIVSESGQEVFQEVFQYFDIFMCLLMDCVKLQAANTYLPKSICDPLNLRDTLG